MSYTDRAPDPDLLASCHPQDSLEDELDFNILFDYECHNSLAEESTPSHKIISPSSSGIAYSHHDVSDYGSKPLAYPRLSSDPMGTYEQHISVGSRYHLDPKNATGAPALSPRIEITPSHELFHAGSNRSRDSDTLVEHQPNLAATLQVYGYDGYREPLCLSPASSGSSTSYISETNFSPYTSPCVSPNNGPNDDLCPQIQNFPRYSPRASPIMSPRESITEDTCLGPRSPSPRPNSRSSSPGFKRRYPCAEFYNSHQTSVSPRQSRTPSPQASPRVHLRDDNSSLSYSNPSASAHLMEDLSLSTDPTCGVPTKMWKNSPDRSPVAPHKSIPCHVYQPPEYLGPYEHDERKNSDPGSILLVPPTWPKQILPAMPYYSIPVASLPPLEWPLTSQAGSYELQIEVQPKPHHRAHYETEGSRGAVKATTGGHPIVQLHGYMENKPLGLQTFIGTADERILKPHAFYQVHRITGKTVTTTSYEKIVGNTKVLEIPLEPKNNMRATIDCAGILKLKNADIELRKGETDIGRKNTRVRLVFRVHIPEASGRIVSLQAASSPIECSQRSAHELPLVERQDIDSCLVYGGQQMILTGQNFTAESKVVFTEKTPDGQQIWETEATVDKDKSQPNMLFVEVPEYRNRHINTPVKVNFNVINGKRKRSQAQHFTYLPVPSIKTEPIDEYSSIVGSSAHTGLGTAPQTFYSQHPLSSDSPSCLANLVSCQQVRAGLPSPDSRYPQQSPSAAVYQRSKSLSPSQLSYHQPSLVASQITIPDPHRSVLVHTSTPVQSAANPQPSPVIHYSPTNHQMRCGSHQEFQHIMCSDFTSSLTRPTQAQTISPTNYPTVIQQQSNSQRSPKSGPPATEQKEILPSGVTVKQEQNLDQAYLDDELIDTNLSWIQNII
ncbi:nuclear factor of activated T-cells, cytoplasmic 2 isoform X3 [Bufo gargarizans]|uniref:nuclear factor of activated T-cells, cytoplasmic 2 isoform X3 n=1 Tax=Bufo gargarizans TaxID=30331 RepID=UPI001CF16D0A|nr:nuclear factor of activated T-cells, cytoplasmic 2 isoform X3 [Bufo gargarizans]